MDHALRFARRPSPIRAAVLCAAALCISCTTKAVLEPAKTERYKAAPDTVSVKAIPKDTVALGDRVLPTEPSSDRFEIKTPEYTYVGYVDYKRAAQLAAGSFKTYVKYGADSSRSRFMVYLDMLVDGKNYLKQGVNLGYLLKDPVYSEIRKEFIAIRPDDDVEAFLDAIDHVRIVGNKDSLRSAYGDGFVNAVLKYSK